jgi:glyoxylase-like metal-dependent hydrolase (beta-lactamase superfamily II)
MTHPTTPVSRLVAALMVTTLASSVLLTVRAQTVPNYEVYAVRFGHVPFGLSNLVAGGDRGTMVDIAFTVWPIKNPATGRVMVFDSGFYHDKFIQQWHPVDYVKPSEAVAAAMGITADDVTDVVISHIHWDHADGAELFPRATVWIQKDEYEYYVGPNGEPLHRADVDVAKEFAALNAAGRIKLINGDDQEIFPGIRAYTGGRHTYASEYLGVHTRQGTVVLASDNAYLFKNLDEHLAIAQTFDAASVAMNLAAQDRMRTLASKPALIIPGHDPAVFDRFPRVKENVVRID